MYKHILVPTDGSKLSLKAAKQAARLAKTFKAKITAVHVIAPYMPRSGAEGYYNLRDLSERYRKTSEANATEALDKVEAAATSTQVRCDKVFLTNDRPWDAIIKTARAKKCDLIVMASHGRSGLAGLLLGSETHKVLTHSKTPVLVCR